MRRGNLYDFEITVKATPVGKKPIAEPVRPMCTEDLLIGLRQHEGYLAVGVGPMATPGECILMNGAQRGLGYVRAAIERLKGGEKKATPVGKEEVVYSLTETIADGVVAQHGEVKPVPGLRGLRDWLRDRNEYCAAAVVDEAIRRLAMQAKP